MKRFVTKYRVGNRSYGADIYANSQSEAEAMCKQRSIGEVVHGQGRLKGGLRRPRTRQEKLHEAIFLGWIALEMGKTTPRKLLGDTGLVHEMVHNMSPTIGHRHVKGLDKHLRKLQRLVPGHRPAKG